MCSRRTNPLILVMICLMVLLAACSSSSDSDVDDIADSLQDQLSDSLEFDNREVVSGDAPEGSDDGPAISDLVMSETLYLGTGFAMELSLEGGDAEDSAANEKRLAKLTATASKVVVQVQGATEHMLLPAPEGSVLLFSGLLKANPNLKGESFTLRIAAQDEQGVTGPYVTHDITVDDPPADEGELVGEFEIEGAKLVSSRPPEGSAGADAPQIVRLEAPSQLVGNGSVLVKLHTDFEGELESALLTLPQGQSYVEIPGELLEDYLKISGSFLGRNLKVGDEISLLWALKATTGTVGLYRLWVVTITDEMLPDGDEDGDLDGDEDGDEEEDLSDGDEDGDEEEDLSDGDEDGDEEEDEVQELVWFDETHNLTWQNPETPFTGNVSEAFSYCNNLSWNGESGTWRLPTISELRTLIQGCGMTQPQGDCVVSDDCLSLQCWSVMECMGCGAADTCYWSDSLLPSCQAAYWAMSFVEMDPDYAWTVNFSDAAIVNAGIDETRAAICVRSESDVDGDVDEDGDMDGDEEDETDGDEEDETDGDEEPLPITCLCTEVNSCCDGCNPINEYDSCSDNNELTNDDHCFGGTCQGTVQDCMSATVLCSDGNSQTSRDYCQDNVCQGSTQSCLETMTCQDQETFSDCCLVDWDCCGDAYCAQTTTSDYGSCRPSLHLTGTRTTDSLIAYSPAGAFYAVAEQSGHPNTACNITIHEATTHTPVRVIKAAPYGITDLAFGRGASEALLAVSSKSYDSASLGGIQLFNWKTGEALEGPAFAEDLDGLSVAFSPSGNRLAYQVCTLVYSTCYSPQVTVLDVADWQTDGWWSTYGVTLTNEPSWGAMTFLSETQLALGITSTSNYNTAEAQIRIYDITGDTTPTDTWTTSPQGSNGVNLPRTDHLFAYLNGEATVVASAGSDDVLYQYNLSSGLSSTALEFTPASVAYSDEYGILALAENETYSGTIHFYNVADMSLVKSVGSFPIMISGGSERTVGPAKDMVYIPYGQDLIFVTDRRRVNRVNGVVSTGTVETLNTHSANIADMQVFPHSALAVTSGYDSRTILWDLARGAMFRKSDNLPSLTAYSNVAVSPDGVWMLQINADRLHVIRVHDGFELFSLEGGNDNIRAVAFSPDGSYFVVADSDVSASGVLRFYSTWYGKKFREIEYGSTTSSLAISADGSRVAVARYYISIYDTYTGEQIKQFQSPYSVTKDLVLFPDGIHAAVADNNSARILNLDTEAVVSTLSFTCAYPDLDVSPDGSLLAMGCGNNSNTINLYDIPAAIAQGGGESIQPTRTIWARNPSGIVHFTSDGKQLVAVENDDSRGIGTVTMHDVADLTSMSDSCANDNDCTSSAGMFCNRYLRQCEEGTCADDQDNDNDGLSDEDDPDCQFGHLEIVPQNQ